MRAHTLHEILDDRLVALAHHLTLPVRTIRLESCCFWKATVQYPPRLFTFRRQFRDRVWHAFRGVTIVRT